jgi:stress response protein SCP2
MKQGQKESAEGASSLSVGEVPDDGWITTGDKKKSTHGGGAGALAVAKLAKPNQQQPKKKSALEGNVFFLPKDLETKLHKSTDLAKTVHGVVQSEMDKEIQQKDSFLSIMGLSPDITDNSYHQATDSNLAKARGSRPRAKQRFTKQTAWSFTPVPRTQTSLGSSTTSQQNDDGFVVVEPTKRSWTKRKSQIVDDNILLDLSSDVLSRGILSFLSPKDLVSLGSCSRRSQKVTHEGFLWKSWVTKDFPECKITPVSNTEWKLAYQVVSSKLDIRMRCSHTKQTFLEDVIGLGLDYTVNPRTGLVDYIAVSQNLLSQTAYQQHDVWSDVFGNAFKLFLPLYFSKEHFRRALPFIEETIAELCKKTPKLKPAMGLEVLAFGRAPPSKKKEPSKFEPNMILDVIPKIVTTFVVLLSDEGTSACQKSFEGFTRIHRLFLALAQEYPSIQREAVRRLFKFIRKEENHNKRACPNLGAILPLLVIVDQQEFQWAKIRSAYLRETFDRSVLWACKKYPQLEKITANGSSAVESTEKMHERVTLTRDAMTVPLRLIMFHVYFLKAACQGSVSQRCHKYDVGYFFQPSKDDRKGGGKDDHVESNTVQQDVGEANNTDSGAHPVQSTETNSPVEKPALLSFGHFGDQVNTIYTITTWQRFFQFVGVAGPRTKDDMAKLLRSHVKNSRRRKYHREGMNFSRIHASGTSKILAKGQQYSASADLKRVVFEDHWTFKGGAKFLDATCLLYTGKMLVHTVDFSRTRACGESVRHSGDVMEAQSGTHTIDIDLQSLPKSITTCVFVISAWSTATLKDIQTASVVFRDADVDRSSEPLCVYKLDAHDKVSHLKSVIMCKLYRKPGGGWHILAIGDSNRGSASNYKPIYNAVQSLL